MEVVVMELVVMTLASVVHQPTTQHHSAVLDTVQVQVLV
jgi:hypothetical protein